MKHPLFMLLMSAAAISTMAISSQVSAKQYYKWVDSQGSTHYTTTPPPKNAKKQGKLDTYGWNNSAPYQPAAVEQPAAKPNATAENPAATAQPQQNSAQPENNTPAPTSNTAQPAI